MKIDPKSGEMSLAWELLMPPFDYDLGDAGKLASDGWMFMTSYNTERATGKLEVTASQRDRDYIVALDWRAAEKAINEGKGDIIEGVKVLPAAEFNCYTVLKQRRLVLTRSALEALRSAGKKAEAAK